VAVRRWVPAAVVGGGRLMFGRHLTWLDIFVLSVIATLALLLWATH
jgi:hypothetical protein